MHPSSQQNNQPEADPPPAKTSAAAKKSARTGLRRARAAATAIPAQTARPARNSLLWDYDTRQCGEGRGTGGIIGIDEAGRGPLAGPVVAAAAFLLPAAYSDARVREHCHDIDDSKKLDRPRREAVYEKLRQWQADGLLRIAAAEASAREIEQHNIIGATALAMRRAVAALNLEAGLPAGLCSKIGGKRAYVPQMCFSAEDCTGALPAAKPKRATSRNLTSAQTELFGEFGNASVAPAVNDGGGDTPHNPAVQPQPGGQDYPSELPRRLATSAQWPEGAAPLVWVDGNPMPERLPWAHTGIVGGDATSLAIAMASIWAKVTRDRIMDDLSSAFPHYGWAGNSGYGTPAHLTALREHGPSVHHRMTFLQKLGLGSDAC